MEYPGAAGKSPIFQRPTLPAPAGERRAA